MQAAALDRGGRSGQLRAGFRAAIPIMLGYAPLAFAYGVLAVQAGLSWWAAVAMSLFVYAGASQFIAVGMIAAGGAPVAIIFTTFVVNLRHLLMSAALSPRLERLHRWRLAAVGFHLTDETFALMTARAPEVPLTSAWIAGVQWGAYLSWVIGSAAGALIGDIVTDPLRWGLDYALTAMFVALLALQARTHQTLGVAVAAAAIYKVTALWLPGHWSVVCATLAAATVGSILYPTARCADMQTAEKVG